MEDLLQGLNDEQLKAVTHGLGPLLIVAGAGTGKTMALTRRYVHLLSSKGRGEVTSPLLTPDNILALTFTEKAAGEMEDRILQLLPNGTYDFWISTFHGFCQRILEKYGLEIGLPTHFKLLNETDAWLLLKRHITELPLDHYRPLGNPVKFLSELLKHFSRAKDEGVSPEQYLEFAENSVLDGDSEFVTGERKRLKELADCFFAYRRILREEGALDFGDLIIETLRLLKERPRVLKELQTQFKYVLVDEFQDTNWAQYELIKLLAGDAKNLTVVGDDDQSIYKFRGASLANILQFRDDFPDAVTVMLTQNYRSHQEILDTAYRSIEKNNPNRLEVRLADTGLSKKLLSARGDGGLADVIWFKTLEDEADGVAARIKELKAADPDLTWNDVAILSRSNDGAEPFIRALERHAIPFRFYALRGLYSKPLIVDLTALFSLLDGYHESSAVWRAMTAPCYSFPPRDIAAFIQYANRKGIPLWQTLREARLIPGIEENAERRASRLVAHIENLAETARRERPLKVFQLLLEKTEYLAHILKLPEQEKVEAIGLLNGFANRIKRYEQSTHGPTLRGFLEELKTEIDSGEEGALHADPDEGPELVKILTVHASKGLEFKHVFIVSMVDQRFPTRPRGESIPLPDGLVNERLPEGDAHVEEERRLFYVAVTRAKESVTFTGAEDYGGTRKKKPSVFLGEAGFDVSPQEARTSSELLSLVPPVMSPEDEEAANREVFELKRRFSFTQLAAFRSCPLQYKFAHVYRIPILGSYHKSFGNSIHHAFKELLELHLKRSRSVQTDLFSAPSPRSSSTGFNVTEDEALAIFESNWIDEWYPDRSRHDEYKKEGRDAVKRMVKQWTEHPPNIAFIEQSFDWRIGDHSLKGSVDRIDSLPNGGHAIYDYKTSEPKSSDDLAKENKEQLWIYQLAMEEKGLDIRKLAYLFVRSGEEAEVELLQGEKRDAFRDEIARRMQEILASRFEPKASSFVCRFCDFKDICEFRKL
ncbi:ATP-dependent helicase [Candidatus Uhrbacteria bacterium]|nr:ATP-dependent helicase [Candidatus Uhrbacteria bacterium]